MLDGQLVGAIFTQVRHPRIPLSRARHPSMHGASCGWSHVLHVDSPPAFALIGSTMPQMTAADMKIDLRRTYIQVRTPMSTKSGPTVPTPGTRSDSTCTRRCRLALRRPMWQVLSAISRSGGYRLAKQVDKVFSASTAHIASLGRRYAAVPRIMRKYLGKFLDLVLATQPLHTPWPQFLLCAECFRQHHTSARIWNPNP